MTYRQRYLETALFGHPDRIPWAPGGPRGSTYARWWKEGLPQGTYVDDYFGLDRWGGVPLNLGPVPAFEETLIETRGDKKIWIDSLGAKRLDFVEDATPGFVTRVWLEFPVKTREDFLAMQERFDPASAARYPDNWDELVAGWRTRDYPLGLTIPWLFWRVRDWVGFHRICELFYDDTAWLQEMFEAVCDFTLAALDRALTDIDPPVDYVFLNEDMAYKTASMVSPEHFRAFMTPQYLRLVERLRSAGVPVIIVDCDGHVSELIPCWLEAGCNAIWPVEIAANNDPIAYRMRWPRDLCIMGTIDKRELAKDKDAVRREVMSKVPWLMERGGYIPSCDHGIPPDVPFANYAYYIELIKELTGG